MAQSICLIGNSHLVAFKLAWDELKGRFPDMSIDMFGAPMDWLKGLEFADGAISPTNERVRNSFATTAAATSIELKRYDAFGIVACGFDLGAIIDQFATHSFYGCKTASANLASYGAFKAAGLDQLNATTARGILALIRRGSDAPVHVFPQPFRSDAILTLPHPRGKHDVWKAVVQNGDDARVAQLFEDVCNDFGRTNRVTVMPQGSQTRSNPILTKRMYNEDAIRLQPGFSTRHRPNDCTHMNKAFGLVVLQDFLGAAASRS